MRLPLDQTGKPSIWHVAHDIPFKLDCSSSGQLGFIFRRYLTSLVTQVLQLGAKVN